MIVLDYGHGIDTPGKRCMGFEEWKFNRDVGKRVETLLERAGIDYHVLVDEDVDIGLRTRVERAKNVRHDLLISIHGNAFHDTSVEGIETFYYSQKGRIAAEIFQRHLIDKLGWKDRGIKKANFYIIKKTPKPAILLELGFYTNESERILMSSNLCQNLMAEAIVEAIKEYESNL